ncbi:MAG: sulfotransferase [Actinomycetota bacterium]|nr:sulfotransferase [Actinomycetota bacterium]
MTPKFKRAWRRAVRGGKSLRSRARRSSGSGEPLGVRPENIIWIFGTGRSGSTWLGSMMESLDGCAMWNEPLVGNLFGNFHYFRVGGRKSGRQYILGERYKETWLGPMRDLVLGGAAARFPELIGGGYLIIKEPNGSIGSPLLMEALPESRMIFLIRDPRDVVASSMDARSEGSWLSERREAQSHTSKPGRNLNTYARMRANSYVQQIEKTRQAYKAHEGRKVMVRYEDLRADTLKTMRRVYAGLEIPVDEAELALSVEKHSWENIPDEEKGEGKKRRKAKPGGWREDLTPKQVEIVEDITAPLLEEFYPDTATARDAL